MMNTRNILVWLCSAFAAGRMFGVSAVAQRAPEPIAEPTGRALTFRFAAELVATAADSYGVPTYNAQVRGEL